MDIDIQKDVNLTIEKALSLEWLEVNGLGGYSSSTILNGHTRKYHGLLVSSLTEPLGKFVLLSKVEDALIHQGQEFLLSAAKYPDFFQSGSFERFDQFQLTTHPCFFYHFGNARLEKEILMIEGENTVLIKYTVCSDQETMIRLRPLIAFRNFHALTHENSVLKKSLIDCAEGKAISPYPSMPTLFFHGSDEGASWCQESFWYHHFEYAEERSRGFDFQEDLFCPGTVVFKVPPGEQEIIFSASLEEQSRNLFDKWGKEISRRKILEGKTTGTDLERRLKTTARSFFFQQEGRLAVIAGYHWFLSWGRDTMISLPGLTLYSGLENECLAILKTYSDRLYQGLIPNFLGLTRALDAYNSVDASLWFGWAVQQYYLKTNNLQAIRGVLWDSLKTIFHWYKNGTLHQIKMNALGLLEAGHSRINLTWMDAMVGGIPAVARYGLMVEINALWFNFLSFIEALARQWGDPIRDEVTSIRTKMPEAFIKIFWDEKLGYLKDVVNPDFEDHSLRPNQIFAVSLPYSLLPQSIASKVIGQVKEKLLTPFGIRTVSPDDSQYNPHYSGDSASRDRAYHNGIVWPWLLGHFTEALLKVSADKMAAKNELRNSLGGWQGHLAEAGIGSISEIFDGEAPFQPRGCISQAWSVAEVLRMSYFLKGDS